MRMPGSCALAAIAIPDASPPPPTGITIVRTSGHCSMISRPTVPWPAITSGWSNGWMYTLPRSCAWAIAAAMASSTLAPVRMTSAP